MLDAPEHDRGKIPMTKSIKTVLDHYPEYEATIGIEVHVQLATQTKIFCACPNVFGQEPNSNICPVCAGYPGTLPMPNQRVVDYAIMAGIATNCKISEVSEFARKHYMYPDLPKNYQITQGDVAICHDGFVPTTTMDGEEKKIRIERIHMEEDAGKAMHAADGTSRVDLNRAGTPLLEIVSAPDIANAHEAKGYLNNLRNIMLYLGISDVNMEEGSFRADINISVKKKSADKLGTRAEIKNVNSFKFIGMAIEYEIERQIEILEEGGSVQQATRLWNEKEQKTVFMRAKGDADDYRYFPEPDLPLVIVDAEWLKRMQQQVPELPLAKKERFTKVYKLSDYDAGVLVASKALAAYFEEAVVAYSQPKMICNWILRDLLGYLKEHKLALGDCKVTPAKLAGLVQAIDKGVINTKAAQEVFVAMAGTGKDAAEIIKEKGLEQVNDTGELEKICQQLVADNPDVVEKYKGGNDRMFGFFVGQAMKATQGKGNPKLISEILRKLL
jgi:aspartyl-tRNA(Asn)/glutamyl-tRNA(Gln) amidotransferase subunit B